MAAVDTSPNWTSVALDTTRLGASDATTDAFAGEYGVGAVDLSVEPPCAEAAAVSLGNGLGEAGVEAFSLHASAKAERVATPHARMLCFMRGSR
jgi:hypothetical protein